ncbi:hypothetical protein [Thomasclavelia cocleata]|uniref:hypothetical protein n=1 Tax=Thomasclavelia cocleata TaxID=69824 RepID=UPI002611F4BC|nr:hypothetical protein [Thomasclavelia cocleata]
MKRKVLIAVVGAMSILLAACGGGGNDSAQQEQATDTQQQDSDKEKLGGVFDVKENEEQKQDEDFIVVDLTMDNVNDYIDFVEYNNSYAIISKQFENGLVFWTYSEDFKLSYKYTLEVDGEQRELKGSMLDLQFNECIESNSKPVITDIKGSITFINADNENVKCEYKDNMRYVEVDGQGQGNEISYKELFEMYPY